MPITKHNYIVKDVKNLADTIRRAFRIAKKGRPGPVLVDIPKDVTANKAEYKAQRIEPVLRVTETIREEDLEEAADDSSKRKKPYIFCGRRCRNFRGCSDELKNLWIKMDAPVCDTADGKKGAFNGTDDFYTGMLGMHGTKTSNLGVSECDLLIAVGVRFSDRVHGNAKKFAKNAKILTD